MNLFRKINDGANSLAIKAMTVTGESKPQSRKAVKAKKILTAVISASIAATVCAVTAFASGGGGDLSFFKDAIDVLKIVVILIGAGVAVWGVINLLEGYSNDNPGAKSQGMKQLMAGLGVALIGFILVPKLADLMDEQTSGKI